MLITLALVMFTGPGRAENYAAHRILDALTQVKVFKPGQSTSIFDLQRNEKRAIAEVRQLSKTNKPALKTRNSKGQTVVMRASEAGFLRLLNALLKLAPHIGDLRARDNRGLTVADHATLAGMRTYKVCQPNIDAGKSDISIRGSYAAVTQAYELILAGLMRHRVPTNPRRVANVWLKACPDAAPHVRRRMKRLSKENSSSKIQNYLLAEAQKANHAAERVRSKIKQKRRAEISKPKLSQEARTTLASAKTIAMGPLKLADNPDGDGVMIAEVSKSQKTLASGPIRNGRFVAAVGQRVIAIEHVNTRSLKHVKKTLNELRSKKSYKADITVLLRWSKNSHRVFMLHDVPIGR